MNKTLLRSVALILVPCLVETSCGFEVSSFTFMPQQLETRNLKLETLFTDQALTAFPVVSHTDRNPSHNRTRHWLTVMFLAAAGIFPMAAMGDVPGKPQGEGPSDREPLTPWQVFEIFQSEGPKNLTLEEAQLLLEHLQAQTWESPEELIRAIRLAADMHAAPTENVTPPATRGPDHWKQSGPIFLDADFPAELHGTVDAVVSVLFHIRPELERAIDVPVYLEVREPEQTHQKYRAVGIPMAMEEIPLSGLEYWQHPDPAIKHGATFFMDREGWEDFTTALYRMGASFVAIDPFPVVPRLEESAAPGILNFDAKALRRQADFLDAILKDKTLDVEHRPEMLELAENLTIQLARLKGQIANEERVEKLLGTDDGGPTLNVWIIPAVILMLLLHALGLLPLDAAAAPFALAMSGVDVPGGDGPGRNYLAGLKPGDWVIHKMFGSILILGCNPEGWLKFRDLYGQTADLFNQAHVPMFKVATPEARALTVERVNDRYDLDLLPYLFAMDALIQHKKTNPTAKEIYDNYGFAVMLDLPFLVYKKGSYYLRLKRENPEGLRHKKTALLEKLKPALLEYYERTGEDLVRSGALAVFQNKKFHWTAYAADAFSFDPRKDNSAHVKDSRDEDRGIRYRKIPPDIADYCLQQLLKDGMLMIAAPEEWRQKDIPALGLYYPADHARHREDELTQDILRLKRDPAFALEFFKGRLAIIKTQIPLSEADVIVPLPAPKGEENHLDAPSQALAQLIGKKFLSGLRRVRSTQKQKDLSWWKRARNIGGAMKAVGRKLEGKTVLILDDVTTTGLSLQEAMRAAYEGGAKRVYLLALAKTDSVPQEVAASGGLALNVWIIPAVILMLLLHALGLLPLDAAAAPFALAMSGVRVVGGPGKEPFLIPDLFRMKKEDAGNWEESLEDPDPGQWWRPRDLDLLKKLGITRGERVFGFAGYAGDWLAELARRGAVVTYTDVNPKVVAWVEEHYRYARPYSELFERTYVANALDEPAPGAYDWHFTYEALPLQPNLWMPVLLRGLTSRKGLISVSIVGDGWDDELQGLREAYGLKGGQFDESRPGDTHPEDDIEFWLEHIRARENSNRPALNHGFLVTKIKTNDRVRALATLDVQMMELLQNYKGNGLPSLRHYLGSHLNVTDADLLASLRRLTLLSKASRGYVRPLHLSDPAAAPATGARVSKQTGALFPQPKKRKESAMEPSEASSYWDKAKTLLPKIGGGPGQRVLVIGPGNLKRFQQEYPWWLPWEWWAFLFGAHVTLFEKHPRAPEAVRGGTRDWFSPSGGTLTIPENDLADFLKADVPPASADLVIMMSVLSDPNFPFEERERLLSKAVGALRPGGHLLIGWYRNLEDDFERTEAVMRLLDKTGVHRVVIDQGAEPRRYEKAHEWVCYQTTPPAAALELPQSPEQARVIHHLKILEDRLHAGDALFFDELDWGDRLPYASWKVDTYWKSSFPEVARQFENQTGARAIMSLLVPVFDVLESLHGNRSDDALFDERLAAQLERTVQAYNRRRKEWGGTVAISAAFLFPLAVGHYGDTFLIEDLARQFTRLPENLRDDVAAIYLLFLNHHALIDIQNFDYRRILDQLHWLLRPREEPVSALVQYSVAQFLVQHGPFLAGDLPLVNGSENGQYFWSEMRDEISGLIRTFGAADVLGWVREMKQHEDQVRFPSIGWRADFPSRYLGLHSDSTIEETVAFFWKQEHQESLSNWTANPKNTVIGGAHLFPYTHLPLKEMLAEMYSSTERYLKSLLPTVQGEAAANHTPGLAQAVRTAA